MVKRVINIDISETGLNIDFGGSGDDPTCKKISADLYAELEKVGAKVDVKGRKDKPPVRAGATNRTRLQG